MKRVSAGKKFTAGVRISPRSGGPKKTSEKAHSAEIASSRPLPIFLQAILL